MKIEKRQWWLEQPTRIANIPSRLRRRRSAWQKQPCWYTPVVGRLHDHGTRSYDDALGGVALVRVRQLRIATVACMLAMPVATSLVLASQDRNAAFTWRMRVMAAAANEAMDEHCQCGQDGSRFLH